MGARVESQGIVGAVQDAVGADEIEDAAEDGRVVEEREGGGVVIDVTQGVAEGGAGGGVEREAAAEVGKNESRGGVGAGKGDVVGEGGGAHAGAGALGGIGNVEVEGDAGIRGEVDEGGEGGVGVRVALDGREEFAESAGAGSESAMSLGEGGGTGGGVGRSEKMDTVGVGAVPSDEPIVLLDAGGQVLPIPAEEDGGLDAGGVHVAEEAVGIGPALDRGFAERGDACEPPSLVAGGGPGAGIGGDGGRVGVDVGVNDAAHGNGETEF